LSSEDLPLYPPIDLVRAPSGDLVALAAEGEARQLALYRGGPDGERWERWLPLPAPPDIVEVDLAAGGKLIALAGSRSKAHAIWFSALLADPEARTDSIIGTVEFAAESTVVSLALAVFAPASDLVPQIHLTYLTGDPADTLREMRHRWSVDGGYTWSDEISLGSGTLGRVACDTRPVGGRAADLAFSRDRFMHWRGLSGRDRTEAIRARLRVAHTSRNEVARMGSAVLLCGESHRNQVVAISSTNAGRNWGTAISLARDSDHRRVPDIDAGDGLFWVVYSSGDTTLTVRAAADPSRPQNWSRGIFFTSTRCIGEPAIVALPDSSAGVLFAAPEGKVYFARVRPPAVETGG
jgi:hypothetical protein